MGKLRVLVAGCGHMGRAHAHAYRRNEGFEVVGLVSRGDGSRESLAAELGGDVPLFADFAAALAALRPDAVSINTYPDSHAAYALAALRAGAHVFVEKPLAETVADAEAVARAAKEAGRKLLVGYILNHHPAFVKLVEIGRTLGKPLAMRISLNQQSRGAEWEKHKRLMASLSPLVDSGVHYVELMRQVTGALPRRVHAAGVRLSDEIAPGMRNYGHMHVTFDDGSVGWFEAGWGPMMGKAGYFIKDFVGPRGSVSLSGYGKLGADPSDDLDRLRPNTIVWHKAARDAAGEFAPDEIIPPESDLGLQDLCDREQAFFLEAIRKDLDLSAHHSAAVDSLRIVLAAEESMRTGKVVEL